VAVAVTVDVTVVVGSAATSVGKANTATSFMVSAATAALLRASEPLDILVPSLLLLLISLTVPAWWLISRPDGPRRRLCGLALAVRIEEEANRPAVMRVSFIRGD